MKTLLKVDGLNVVYRSSRGSPVAGIAIAEGVRFVVRRHRAKPLYYTVIVGVILGALPVLLTQLFILNLFGILFQVIYLGITIPTVYTRLSGIQIFR